MPRTPDVTVAAVTETAGRSRLRSPLVLRCVHAYLTGRRLALEAVAGLDLHAAGAASADAVSL